ncbi:16S rRNA (adenine(1518)-N(6)/adenine(1519)-N(6))-dimethyltransferase RsmA [Candidatus Bathyarchaeota archaeon]|nr:16S rRNA (adenine(1518)-N(6)/adenine(1519)-N(6))-dimethyltransferase RsmA [Candidatus Bathyarchaeota archaeon]
MSLLEEARHLLTRYNIRPNRRLGQNFCIDPLLLQKLIDYCDIGKGDVVLEIGAGLGFLTSLLANRAREVLAVEVDSSLVEVLKERFNDKDNVRIIKEDILDLKSLVFHKVVANPPYTISSPLLTALLNQDFSSAVLSLQLEFAQKLTAHESESNYGLLSILARYRGKVEILDHIPRDAFYPAPKVESAIVRIITQSPPFLVRDKEIFQELVKSLFTQRRRKVRNALQYFLRDRAGTEKREMPKLIEAFPHLEERIVELQPADFGELANTAVDLVRGKRVEYEDLVFYVFPDVYVPSDDTFLLAQNIVVHPEEKVLDIGTGCGVIGILAATKGGQVTAVDINPFAIQCSRLNARLNGVSERFSAKSSDLFQDLNGEEFDLIVFNPPYLPQEKYEASGGWLEKAWQGGPSGLEVIERFMKEVRNHIHHGGEIVMVLSSLSCPEKAIAVLKSLGFSVEVLANEKLDFEELIVLKAR